MDILQAALNVLIAYEVSVSEALDGFRFLKQGNVGTPSHPPLSDTVLLYEALLIDVDTAIAALTDIIAQVTIPQLPAVPVAAPVMADVIEDLRKQHLARQQMTVSGPAVAAIVTFSDPQPK